MFCKTLLIYNNLRILINIIKNLFLDRRSNPKNVEEYLVFIFSLLIIIGGLLNTLSNKTYLDDSWTIGEWLINYQGGFIRRGLLGEGIYILCNLLEISPIFIIWFISISCYCILLRLTIFESKNQVSNLFLLSPGVFLAPIIGNFLIRKDLLLLLIFLVSLKLIKLKRPNLVFLNLLNITGLLIHESFAIYALPIQFFILKKKYDFYRKNSYTFLNLLPSFCSFIFCLIFKGDQNQAISIHQSWLNKSFLFPFEKLNYEIPLGAIDAISWDFIKVLKILLEALTDFKGIFWVPLAWITTTIVLASFFLGDNAGKDFKIKSFIMYFQFFPFAILCFAGWDYGRWIFIWIVSSILIYCTFGEELKSYNSIQQNLIRYNLIEKYFLKIELHKRSKILLAIFAYPHCCWSLFYLPSLLIAPGYSILKIFKSFFK